MATFCAQKRIDASGECTNGGSGPIWKAANAGDVTPLMRTYGDWRI